MLQGLVRHGLFGEFRARAGPKPHEGNAQAADQVHVLHFPPFPKPAPQGGLARSRVRVLAARNGPHEQSAARLQDAADTVHVLIVLERAGVFFFKDGTLKNQEEIFKGFF